MITEVIVKVTCNSNGCRERIDVELDEICRSNDEQIEKALKREGWIGEWEHFCPECKAKLESEEEEAPAEAAL